MTFRDISNMQLGDSAQMDAFARLRISDPYTAFDSNFQYGKRPDVWEEWFSAGGSSVARLNYSGIALTVNNASGAKCTRQTHQYFRYKVGKSHLIFLGGVMGAPVANLRRRCGYFDDMNGIIIEQTVSGLAFRIRSFTSGVAVDSAPISSIDWNIDKMDGTGPSGITLNQANGLIWVIDIEGTLFGRVRIGLFLNGKLFYCHQIFNANNIALPYMTTPNLPIRYEIENLAATAGTNTYLQMGCTIISEEDGDLCTTQKQAAWNINPGVSCIANIRRPILSLSPQLLEQGIVNRGQVLPKEWSIGVVPNSNNMMHAVVELVLGWPGNPVTLTNANWQPINALSIAQYDVSATAISGGQVIDVTNPIALGNSTSANVGVISDDLENVILGLNYNGTIPDTLSIVVTPTISSTFTGNIIFGEEF